MRPPRAAPRRNRSGLGSGLDSARDPDYFSYIAAMSAPRAVAVSGSEAMRTSEISIGIDRDLRARSKRSLKPRGFAVPPERTIERGRSLRGSFSALEVAR